VVGEGVDCATRSDSAGCLLLGRLQEDGSRDVEVLCTELAAHHGRTIIARVGLSPTPRRHCSPWRSSASI